MTTLATELITIRQNLEKWRTSSVSPSSHSRYMGRNNSYRSTSYFPSCVTVPHSTPTTIINNNVGTCDSTNANSLRNRKKEEEEKESDDFKKLVAVGLALSGVALVGTAVACSDDYVKLSFSDLGGQIKRFKHLVKDNRELPQEYMTIANNLKEWYALQLKASQTPFLCKSVIIPSIAGFCGALYLQSPVLAIGSLSTATLGGCTWIANSLLNNNTLKDILLENTIRNIDRLV